MERATGSGKVRRCIGTSYSPSARCHSRTGWRKIFPQDDCAARHQNRPRHLHPTNTVVHRQTVIHPVRCLRTHHAGKPVAPLHDPRVADVGGFGQPGCTGGIDVERFIFYGRWPLLVLAERAAGLCFDLQIETRPRAGFVAMNPDRGRQRQPRESSGELAGELRTGNEMFR